MLKSNPAYSPKLGGKGIAVDLNTVTGLSEQEAIALLKQDGYNELPSAEARNFLAIAWDTIKDPIFLLLVGGGIVYLILGDLQEALILLGFVTLIVGIGLYQEGKTEHALEALRDLSSPRALVIRDGQQKRIAGREVVIGDILVLAEGDRVPADAIVLSSSNLSTDESLLTGESLPVRKVASANTNIDNVKMARPGGDDLAFVYSGTLVIQGQGVAQVKAIASQTEMGKIGKALQKVKPELTPLQQEMNRLVNRLFGIALSLCVAIVVIYGATTGDWLKGFLAGITLAMAILPNEFPVVVTVFLALGAWRISQNHVLARRPNAVETLGSATVLCVDKTGTLTLNQMAVQQLEAYNSSNNNDEYLLPYDLGLHPSDSLPESLHQLVEFCILASQRDPFDPMEKAFKQLGDRNLAHTEHLHSDWQLLREYPLSPHLLAMSHVWQSADGKQYEIAAKGAPEAIALVIYSISLYLGEGELNARTLTFTTLILANLGLILSASSTSRLTLQILKSSNAALWWVIGCGLFFLAIVLYFPFLRDLFSFSSLHAIDVLICILGGAISLVWFEQLKEMAKTKS
jgi:P-type Ca2+ transporter type 2C